MVKPKLIIHGGAGNSMAAKGALQEVRKSLYAILDRVYPLLEQGKTAKEAVVKGCELLEDEPRYNAGTGSVLQSDGQIRMSAGLMDGSTHSFSGVINVSRVKNPIDLALALQTSKDRILSEYGCAEFMREFDVPIYNPMTDKRLQEWVEERKNDFQRKSANVLAGARTGTIGVVALDSQGRIAVGTSTGGKGFEKIGRVSDSPMPAGNYANEHAGMSCTGIGEDIIDECFAARVVIRVTDGLSLRESLSRSFKEATDRQRDFAAISIDRNGTIGWGKSCDLLTAAFHDGDKIGDSLEAEAGTQVFTLDSQR
ncbi:MAG: isoaspartyl peptidase/L-asparaginase [Microcoleaceae cyanobacterium]